MVMLVHDKPLPAQLPGLCFLLGPVLPAPLCDWSDGSSRVCCSSACCPCSPSSGSGKGA